jgi:hypothetical protein
MAKKNCKLTIQKNEKKPKYRNCTQNKLSYNYEQMRIFVFY